MPNLTDNFRRAPFVRFILPFITGIATSYFFRRSVNISSLIILCAIFLLLVFLRKSRYRTAPLFGIFLHLFFFIFGWYWYQLRQYKPAPIPKHQSYFAAVYGFPEGKANSYKVILQLLPKKQQILTYLEKDSVAASLRPGQVIAFHRHPSQIKRNTNPGAFNYREYMRRHNIARRLYLRSEDYFVTNRRIGFSIQQRALIFRKHLLKIFAKYGFSGNEMGILSALVLGDRENLDPELKQEFSNSGVVHILAVSGLHVGIIYFVFSFLLQFLKTYSRGRFIRLVFLLTLIWFYAFITGLSPSVLRATTMFSFIAVGENMNRRSNIYNTLGASAFLLLLINPMLLFEVGFQLSYTAVLSIVFFQPLLYNLFYTKSWLANQFWTLLTVSIAAQIGVSPLSIYYFHQFPVYFWLTNLFAIPLTTAIIYAAFLLISVSFIPLAGKAIALILHLLLHSLLHTVETVNQIPGATIPNISFTAPMLIISLLCIIFFTLFITEKQKIFLKLILLSSIFYVSLITWNKYSQLTHRELVFFDVPGKTLIAAIHGKNMVWISSEDSALTMKKMAIYMKPFEQTNSINTSAIIPLTGEREQRFSFLRKKNHMLFFAGMQIWLPGKLKKPVPIPPTELIYLHHPYPDSLAYSLAERHPSVLFITNTSPYPEKPHKKDKTALTPPSNLHSLAKEGALGINVRLMNKDKKSGIKLGYITH